MATDAQRAAYRRYAAAGKRGQLNLTTSRVILDDITAYAASRGMTAAQCARDCIRRCMDADGWTDSAGVGIEPRGSSRSSELPGPIMSGSIGSSYAAAADPGRPEDLGRPEEHHSDGAAPVQRRRGRPRKVQP